LSGGAIPLPLTAVQILAVDLGTETLPALALGRDPAEPGIMEQPPRARTARVVDRKLLVRAWAVLGAASAVLTLAGFLWVLLRAGWQPGDDTSAGAPLHDDWLRATTMTFAGIVACQVGTAFASRVEHTSSRAIGWRSNPLLLWGIVFELVFAAALIYFPPLQAVFGTRPLGLGDLAILATFPFIVWGIDELRRWRSRRGSSSDSLRMRSTSPLPPTRTRRSRASWSPSRRPWWRRIRRSVSPPAPCSSPRTTGRRSVTP
jgi:magnesium-transporting ATPase (P-type)